MFELLDHISQENLRLIPQKFVKHAFFPSDERKNAIWDMFVTRNGRCFLSLCAELGVSESASLYEYIYETNVLKCCFDLDRIICTFPDAIKASKIHTSMQELEDGRLVMTTHTTAQSPMHPYWHPEPFYNHVFEGYQGSHILIYDPISGTVENRGIPIPHETIYGTAYDPAHRALYFTGYFRGHLYRYDLDSGCVRDYGKVTEFGSFRLHRGRDGNIYSASRSGYFYRVNTTTREIEELGVVFPRDYEPYSTGKHVQLDYLADGADGGLYLKYIFGRNLYRYDYEKNLLEKMGDYKPESLEIADPYSVYGMAFDENNVLWYTVCGFDSMFQMCSSYLCRWDVIGGGKPECFGLLGTPERSVATPSEIHYHDGILYIADSNRDFNPPAMMAVDLRAFTASGFEKGEPVYSRDMINYFRLKDPRKYYPYSLEEYKKQEEKHQEFLDYSRAYAAFLEENPLGIQAAHVEAYAFWKEYGCACSPVRSVRYQSGGFLAEFGNEEKKFCFDTRTGQAAPISRFTSRERPDIPVEKSRLPHAVGRNFRANVTAAVQMADEKYLLGTEDGMLGIYDRKTGAVFSLGACPNTCGAIRDLCYCEKTQTAYGVAGGKNDIGVLFSFDWAQGIRYWGRAHFNIESGLHVSNELSCIAVSDDGRQIAFGSDERMGILYILHL